MTADDTSVFLANEPVDADRVRALSIEIAMMAHVHDMLAVRANGDPELLEMIELSRRYWTMWHGMGLIDCACFDDRQAPALQCATSEIEADMLAKGLRHYRRFVSWATQDTNAVPYEPPPFIDLNEDWEKWERGPHAVERTLWYLASVLHTEGRGRK